MGFGFATGEVVFFGNTVALPREVDFFAAVFPRAAGAFAVGFAAAFLEVAMDFAAGAEG